MARYTISGTSSAAATSTLPAVSLYAVSGVAPKIYRIMIGNTTSTAFYVAVNRLTTAGTQGSGLTEVKLDPDSVSASATGFAAHTGTPPTLSDELERYPVSAAAGGGVILTYDDANPLRIPAGTSNGIGILCPSGLGQIFTYVLEWSE